MHRQPKHTLAAKRERLRRKKRLAELMAQQRTSQQLVEIGEFLRCHVEPKWRLEEPALTQSCWVEYGYLSALERTCRFTEVYATIYRRFWEKYVNHSNAEDQKPTDHWAGNTQTEMTSFWRARQAADRLGMPYDTFLTESFEYMLQKEGHRKQPRPNQLYDKPVLDHLKKYWGEFEPTARLLTRDWDERFRVERYAGDPVQDRAHALQLDRLQQGSPSALSDKLRIALVTFPVLPISVARRKFGDTVVDEALRGAGALPAQPADDNRPNFIQGCIGLAFDKDPAICAACPQRTACRSLSKAIDARCKREYGDPEPRAAEVRLQATKRKQKSRAQQRVRQNEEARLPEPNPESLSS